MHQRRTITAHEEISARTESVAHIVEQRDITDDQQQTRRTIDRRTVNDSRAKSADYIRTTSSAIASSSFSSSSRRNTTGIDQGYRIKKEDEQQGLQTLNSRFASYLQRIKNLVDTNSGLRSQIDGVYRTYMGHGQNGNSPQTELTNVRRQLNAERRQSLSAHIRLQRADHDRKYYRNKLELFSTSEQMQLMQQKLDGDAYELNFLKEQYDKQRRDLQSNKQQYDEYFTKLNAYVHDYYNIVYERVKTEGEEYTLKERVLFEQEYNHRCLEEFHFLDKIQHDSNSHFTETELKDTMDKIREDYRKYHQSQLAELEVLYQTNLESFRQDLSTNEKATHSQEWLELNEQNQCLRQRLKQMENDLHHIVEQHQLENELLTQEHHQLELQLPELESLILYGRSNTVHLSSEIDTYKCLLLNLAPSPEQKLASISSLVQASGFTLYNVEGMLWVRI